MHRGDQRALFWMGMIEAYGSLVRHVQETALGSNHFLHLDSPLQSRPVVALVLLRNTGNCQFFGVKRCS